MRQHALSQEGLPIGEAGQIQPHTIPQTIPAAHGERRLLDQRSLVT